MQNVLITGGAGFLSRAYLRWARENAPSLRFTIFSRDEGKHSKCRREFPEHRYMIGDVRDYDSVERAIVGHDTVIHAAAFKYVPQAEINVAECMAINVDGSRNVALASMRTGVERVVGISTDKACEPCTVYGLSKLGMERIFQEASRTSATNFNIVRYGNVVSSTGSVIPLFRRQAREGVIKVTNPKMTRFWLTVNEAVELINMALIETKGGTIIIPRLPSLEIEGVAQAAAFIELGHHNSVQYEVVGARYAEKTHEDLIGRVESFYAEPMGMAHWRIQPMTTELSITLEPKVTPFNSANAERLSIEEMAKMATEAPE